jgi:predicted metal-binding transcription factor (methanogenesis marker protein 9)
MPMGMPYPKGDMAMQKKKMSMSEMMGVEKKMPDNMMSQQMMKAKAKGKKMPFTKKK